MTIYRLVATLLVVGALSSAPWSACAAPSEAELFGTPLSAEADEWLTAANTEFNAKQARLREEWLNGSSGYRADTQTGWLQVNRPAGSVCFDSRMIGSARARDGSWEWAWYNPNMAGAARVDGARLKEIGERLGLRYLNEGMFTMPSPPDLRRQFPHYLSGIVLKATGGVGVYVGESRGTEFFLLLDNPRPGACS